MFWCYPWTSLRQYLYCDNSHGELGLRLIQWSVRRRTGFILNQTRRILSPFSVGHGWNVANAASTGMSSIYLSCRDMEPQWSVHTTYYLIQVLKDKLLSLTCQFWGRKCKAKFVNNREWRLWRGSCRVFYYFHFAHFLWDGFGLGEVRKH